MTSAIVWRTYAQAGLDEMAAHAGVPVVNALSDDFHPCQILADWQTVIEHKGHLAGLTVAYLGDGANNMGHSYLLGGATAGMHVRIGAPAGYQPDPAIVADAEKIAGETGGSVTVTDDPKAAISGADVVITDTWISMGQESEKEARLALFGEFAITAESLALGGTCRDRAALPPGLSRSRDLIRGARRPAERRVGRGGEPSARPEGAARLAAREGPGMTVPPTKAARQQLIVELLGHQLVRSQGDLAELLESHGVGATPSTISRDLVELDAVRVRHPDGGLVYAVPAEGGDRTPRPAAGSASGHARLAKILRELMVTAEGSANLVVLRTPPGAAQYLASAIDHASQHDLLGTIAGDDTVMLICRDPEGGEAVAERFAAIAASTPKEPT